LQTIRESIDLQSFQTWFAPIRPVSLQEAELTIQVPHRIHYEYLESQYLHLLRHSIRQHLGERGKLLYQILNPNVMRGESERGKVVTRASKNDAPQKGDPGTVNSENIMNPFIIPGIKKLKVKSNLNDRYTFESFIEGDCNQLARSAGLAIADRPGNNSFNPLVIYGDVGLGKTHLAQAVGNRLLERHPKKSVVYVTTDRFTNEIITAIKNNAIQDLMSYYTFVDLLIVDDIQFLAGKAKTQEIFFNIFNHLRQNNKQIILTSDRPPKEMEGIEERLISRFKWGLVADLQAPDLETRMAILAAKSSDEGFEIPVNVTEFICFHIKKNIRELEGALNSLMVRATLKEGEIDINLAKEVVRNFVTQINREITVESIQKLVASHFNLDVSNLSGKTRRRQVVFARQLSMYLAKNMTDKSLKAIGETFGGRDHSTVIYSINTVQDLMETDTMIKGTVSELEHKIRMSLHE
jgi:chromosomal replication initiator protein